MSRYVVYVTPDAWNEIRRLPGNMRQRTNRAIDALAEEPRPPRSTALDITDLPDVKLELRRLRMERWRIVYAVSDTDLVVDILTVRKRPPYDYADLIDLIDELL